MREREKEWTTKRTCFSLSMRSSHSHTWSSLFFLLQFLSLSLSLSTHFFSFCFVCKLNTRRLVCERLKCAFRSLLACLLSLTERRMSAHFELSELRNDRARQKSQPASRCFFTQTLWWYLASCCRCTWTCVFYCCCCCCWAASCVRSTPRTPVAGRKWSCGQNQHQNVAN